MKRRHKFCVESLEPRRLLAGWSTVDVVNLPSGASGAVGGMAADGVGHVYAAAYAQDSGGVYHGIIREQTNGVWKTVEDVPNASFQSVAVDAAGDVFACGYAIIAIPGQPPDNWIVAERPAGQTTFTVVKDSPHEQALGINADSSGYVYVVGASTNSTSSTWLVRKEAVSQLLAGRSAFVTVDEFTLGQANAVTSIPSGPAAGLYVAGSGNSLRNWLVRKSTDGGATWTTVDTFGNYPNNQALAVAGDGAGNIYVAGRVNENGRFHWIVRESSNGGSSWSIADDFAPGTSTNGSTAWAIGFDQAGNAYVTGTAEIDSFALHAIIRSNSGGSWHTVDDYLGPSGASAGNPYSFTVDSFGNLYAGGSGVGGLGALFVRSTAGFAASTLTPFGTTVSGVADYPLSAVVGSFTDAASNAKLSNYTASINWGDGSTSTGTITFNSSTRRYDVTGGHTYAVAGAYAISIAVKDSAGGSTTINSTADIAAPNPTPGVTGPSSVNEGGSMTVKLSTADTGRLAISEWVIDWGDGSVQQLSGVASGASHVYDDGPASELISATATDAKGFSATAMLPVLVEDVAPTALFSVTSPASAGAFGTVRVSSVFDPSVADTDAGFRYSFDWDNDGVFEIVNSLVSTAPIPANYLSTPGPHIVMGRIADKDGLFTDYTATVQVGAVGSGSAALSAASRITAGLFSNSLPVQITAGGNLLLNAGDWLEYRVDFGSAGVKKAKMQLSAIAGRVGLKVQLRLDDPDGQIVASFSRRAAASHGQVSRSQNVTGVHDLYLEVVGGQAQVNWFSFVLIVAKHRRGHAK